MQSSLSLKTAEAKTTDKETEVDDFVLIPKKIIAFDENAENETKAIEHFKNTLMPHKAGLIKAIETYGSLEYSYALQNIPLTASFDEGFEELGRCESKMKGLIKHKDRIVALERAATFAEMLDVLKDYDTSQNSMLTSVVGHVFSFFSKTISDWKEFHRRADLFKKSETRTSDPIEFEKLLDFLMTMLRNNIVKYAHKKGYPLELPKPADSKDENQKLFKP